MFIDDILNLSDQTNFVSVNN